MDQRQHRAPRLIATTLALLVVSCGGTPIRDDGELVLETMFHVEHPSLVGTTYLSALTSGDRILVYLETLARDERTAYGLVLDDAGQPLGVPTLAVPSFREPFGEPQPVDDALLIPVVQLETETEMVWELWRWSPETGTDRILQCVLPRAVHGQVLEAADEVFVLLEDTAGSLRGFRGHLQNPTCPAAEALVTLAHAPLPDQYLVDWMDGQILLSGQSGDSFLMQFFNRDLQPVRRTRLATGSALSTTDLRVQDLPELGPVAVFSMANQGAIDLYLASLQQISAGPLRAIRIVGTAETERAGHLFFDGGQTVVSWQIRDPRNGEVAELVATLRLDGTVHRGGEVVWRHDPRVYPLFCSVWTTQGSIRLWIERDSGYETLAIQRYRPSIW